jgi:hypothetical protein
MFDFLSRLKALLASPYLGDSLPPCDPETLTWTRTPARDRDRVLLSQTHLWLRQIPSSLLPKHLCRLHPHIANRFAECWGDRERFEACIDDLLIDRRGGRKGFSGRVRNEIEQLELLHARWMADPAGATLSLVARRRTIRSPAPDNGEGPRRSGLPVQPGDPAQRSLASMPGA